MGAMRYCSKAIKSKILVVDDNSAIRKLLVLRLRESSYETVEAATGLQAVKQARTTRPDLIIMDLGMPAGTGDDAIVSLKADPATRDIPVIAPGKSSQSCYRCRRRRGTPQTRKF